MACHESPHMLHCISDSLAPFYGGFQTFSPTLCFAMAFGDKHDAKYLQMERVYAWAPTPGAHARPLRDPFRLCLFPLFVASYRSLFSSSYPIVVPPAHIRAISRPSTLTSHQPNHATLLNKRLVLPKASVDDLSYWYILSRTSRAGSAGSQAVTAGTHRATNSVSRLSLPQHPPSLGCKLPAIQRHPTASNGIQRPKV